MQPKPPQLVSSLESSALHAYLYFLERESAAYVALATLNSPWWNPMKERLLDSLKTQLDSVVKGPRGSQIRRRLFRLATSGQFPSPIYRNSHTGGGADQRPLGHDDDDDDGEAAVADLEKIKHFGRKCCSSCCTGAFLLEVMLAVIVHPDVEELIFPARLRSAVYKKKSISQFLFIDVPSVLWHYSRRLSLNKTPLLRMLVIGSNLGSLDSQMVNECVLKAYPETRRYLNFSRGFSGARPTTDSMMVTLAALFCQPKDYFRHLRTVKLSRECLNSRTQMADGADANGYITLFMRGLARSCPILESLDLSEMTSLYPENLIHLFYQDAFAQLHQRMYLPLNSRTCVRWRALPEEIAHHDDLAYCRWCHNEEDMEVPPPIHVLDDRLYDFIVRKRGAEFERESEESSTHLARQYLLYCVKLSDMLHALGQKQVEGRNADYRSALCRTLCSLQLPNDIVDSKAWIVPLILCAAPQVETLGATSAYNGLKIADDLGLKKLISMPTRLKEISLCFDDFTSYRVKEQVIARMKSLVSKHTLWSIFCGQVGLSGDFTLRHWIETELDEVLELPNVDGAQKRWRRQVDSVVAQCPDLDSVHMSIQPLVLSSSDRDMWWPLADLEHINELLVTSSCWSDVLGLLQILGKRLERLSLALNAPKSMRDDDINNREFINTLAHLCPNLYRLCLGSLQAEVPHSLCSNPRYDKPDSYAKLGEFEASGNITLEALQFVWSRAKHLKLLRVTGIIVSSMASAAASNTSDGSNSNAEVVLNKDRVSYLFSLNPMSHLTVIDVNMTLSSIVAAQTLLDSLPTCVESVATLNVKVSIPESLEGENFGDLVSSVLARMASFKTDCLSRSAEVVWNWKREGILTILLQQQMLLAVADLIDP